MKMLLLVANATCFHVAWMLDASLSFAGCGCRCAADDGQIRSTDVRKAYDAYVRQTLLLVPTQIVPMHECCKSECQQAPICQNQHNISNHICCSRDTQNGSLKAHQSDFVEERTTCIMERNASPVSNSGSLGAASSPPSSPVPEDGAAQTEEARKKKPRKKRKSASSLEEGLDDDQASIRKQKKAKARRKVSC